MNRGRINRIDQGLLDQGRIDLVHIDQIRIDQGRIDQVDQGRMIGVRLIGVGSIKVGWIRVGSIPDIRNGVTQHNFSGHIDSPLFEMLNNVMHHRNYLTPSKPSNGLPLVAINTEKCRCKAYSTPIQSICRKSKC